MSEIKSVLLPLNYLLEVPPRFLNSGSWRRNTASKSHESQVPSICQAGLRKSWLTFSCKQGGTPYRGMCAPHHSLLTLPSPSLPLFNGLRSRFIHGEDEIAEHLDNVKQNKIGSSSVNHLKIIHYTKIYWFASCEGDFYMSIRLATGCPDTGSGLILFLEGCFGMRLTFNSEDE